MKEGGLKGGGGGTPPYKQQHVTNVHLQQPKTIKYHHISDTASGKTAEVEETLSESN